jgi:hypothetical protein
MASPPPTDARRSARRPISRGAEARRPIRRTALVFAATLAAHLLVFQAVGTQVFRPHFDLSAYETPATPLSFAPPPKLAAKPKPAAKPKLVAAPRLHARLSPAIAPAPIEIARAEPPPVGDASDLAAPLAPPSNATAPANAPAPPPDLTAQAGPQPQYPINPGYWRVEEHWPLINRTELYCIEPWNITRFLLAPCNHIYTCVYPVQQLGPDSVHFKGVITGKNDRFDVQGGGAYTPTSLHLRVSLLGHWHIVPVIFAASLDGQYLAADCPADAKHIRQR